MLLKWSQEEDVELSRIIRKHGTSDWALVRKHFKSNRSRDSVIKRWHGKLKFQRRVQVSPPEKTKKIASDRRREAPNKKGQPSKKLPEPVKRESRVPAANSIGRSQRLRNLAEARSHRERRSPSQSEDRIQSEDEMINDEQFSSSDAFTLEWTRTQDEKLLSLVLQKGLTSWQRIGNTMGCSQKQAKNRWKMAIYDMIKLDDKVGGFLKYSIEEDTILNIGNRNGLNWNELMNFLPGRSQFSIQARWRRLLRPELEVELSRNKHYVVREFLKKIIEKRRGEREVVEQQLQISEHIGKAT